MDKRFLFLTDELARTKVGKGSMAGLPEYLQLAFNDFVDLIRQSIDVSRPQTPYADKFDFSIVDGNAFDVYVERTGPTEIGVRLTFGTLLALDDLCMRLAVSGDFFAFEREGQLQRLWNGCMCDWLSGVGILFPRRRYFNYSPEPRIDFERMGSTYASFPFEAFTRDKQRRKMADLLFRAALLWILMHEEAHYAHGHINFLGEFDAARHLAIGETASLSYGDPKVDPLLAKALEWQANREATQVVMDVYFRESYFDSLPGYCNHDRAQWLFSLLLSAIGLVIQIIQKARIISKANDRFYPLPRTRLIAAVHIALGAASNPYLPTIKRADKDAFGAVSTWRPAIEGALGDLNTVASLINNDGDVVGRRRSEKASGSGLYPLLQHSQSQLLLDGLKEAQVLGDLLKLSMLPQELRHDWMAERGMAPRKIPLYLELQRRWYQELDLIVGYHDGGLWDALRPYRHQVGNFFD